MLLYRADGSGPLGKGAAVDDGADGLQLQAQSKVSFDTYFNCFYEVVWHDHTEVREIVLEAETEGPLKLSVFRSGLSQVRQPVATSSAEDGRKLHRLRIPATSKALRGRLHLEVEATGTGPAHLIGARWTSPRAALRQPKLTVAMCTFNKPQAVAGNVAAVLDAVGGEDWFHEMIVVDQGTSKVADHPQLKSSIAHDGNYQKLRIVEQGNFGGAGGFGRGMMEALAEGSVTHVTLMDDDVEVEPRVLARLYGFLCFVRKDVIVGGQMFDMYSPLTMRTFAEAANYRRLAYFHVGPHDVDFGQPYFTGLLEGAVKPTYNGWWLCTYPRTLIEEHGLPLPVFVRCDDSEYSTRMTSQGVNLVSLPGFMVWHEPFHAKIVAWMMYYETRNFLLLASLRAGPHRFKTMLILLARIWTFAARGLYDHSEALLKALETYLDGPAWLREDPRERHIALTRELKALAPQTLPDGQRPGYIVDPWADPSLQGGRVRRFAHSLHHHLIAAPKTAEAEAPLKTIPMYGLIWPILNGRRALGVYNPYTNQSFVVRINRAQAREHLRRGFALIGRWSRTRKQLAAEYKAAAKQATTKAAWQDYLGIDQG